MEKKRKGGAIGTVERESGFTGGKGTWDLNVRWASLSWCSQKEINYDLASGVEK